MSLVNSKEYITCIDKLCDFNPYIPMLRNKSLLITGATGMIGSCVVDTIMRWNERQVEPCHVYVMSRSFIRAKARFSGVSGKDYISYVEGNVYGEMIDLPEKIDYIIHAASNADPIKMSTAPVDTLLANVEGTKNLIEYGKSHGMRRFLYLSSGEMYGQPNEGFDDFVEDYCGPIDHSDPRSCYPAGKRAAEVLCQSYISQYGVDAVIVRPCHIFGATMTSSDSRAVSEFFRSAVKGENIVLKSAGLIERSHCNVVDATNAILFVLLNGKCGEAYNIADKQYQMTIRCFAEEVAHVSGTNVVFSNPSDIEAKGYSRIGRAVLSAEKLENIGWKSLHEGLTAIEETYLALKSTINLP